MKKKANSLILGMVLSGFFVGAPHAAQASQVDLLIEKLVEKKILTRMEAQEIILEVEKAEKKDYQIQVRQETPWLENLSSKGDIRLRYEGIERESEDSSDRNRFRLRLRWGLEKKFNDEWKAGFRLASGESANTPTSTNQTLDGEFGFKNIFIDRAYAKFTPTQRAQEMLGAGVNAVEVGAGKVENPYDRDRWNSTIIWDSDVTPEGIYEKMDFRLMDDPASGAFLDLNTLQGQWVIDEDSDLSPGDHEMLSYGFGVTYQWKKNHDAALKVTYYDWQDYAQFIKSSSIVNENLGGNDREVSDFKILNFYAETNFEVQTWWWETQPLKVYGDYANNTGLQDDIGTTDESLQNPALRGDSDDAFSVGLTLGKAKDRGSWAFTYEYLYIEPNAVVGNFSEADLGVGFANNQGHRLSWKYMLLKDLELQLSAWLVERVDTTKLTFGASSLRPNGDDDQVFRAQFDLVWKF